VAPTFGCLPTFGHCLDNGAREIHSHERGALCNKLNCSLVKQTTRLEVRIGCDLNHFLVCDLNHFLWDVNVEKWIKAIMQVSIAAH